MAGRKRKTIEELILTDSSALRTPERRNELAAYRAGVRSGSLDKLIPEIMRWMGMSYEDVEGDCAVPAAKAKAFIEGKGKLDFHAVRSLIYSFKPYVRITPRARWFEKLHRCERCNGIIDIQKTGGRRRKYCDKCR